MLCEVGYQDYFCHMDKAIDPVSLLKKKKKKQSVLICLTYVLNHLVMSDSLQSHGL